MLRLTKIDSVPQTAPAAYAGLFANAEIGDTWTATISGRDLAAEEHVFRRAAAIAGHGLAVRYFDAEGRRVIRRDAAALAEVTMTVTLTEARTRAAARYTTAQVRAWAESSDVQDFLDLAGVEYDGRVTPAVRAAYREAHDL